MDLIATRMRVVGLVTCLLTATLASPVVAQDNSDKVEQLYAAGAALYNAGKYRAAAERWEEAYALYPEPNLLYNLGRAYEALGELEKAKKAFETCAAAKDVSPDVKKKALGRVATVTSAMAAAAEATPEPLPPKEEPQPQPQPPADRGTSGMAIAGWTSAAVGGGLLIGGGVVYALGLSDHGEVDDAKSSATSTTPANLTQTRAQELVDSGDTKKTFGVILASSGLALGALGATLLLLDSDEPQEVQVSATPLRGGGAFVIGGQF